MVFDKLCLWWINEVFFGSVLVFFFFLINCVRVLGLHSGDGGDGGDVCVCEREREREILKRDINIFYCVNILF